jgi:putative NADH-flavin reductase
MKILVIGAAGNTGITLVRMAMAEGLQVSALVRNEAEFKARLQQMQLPAPEIIVGNATDPALVSHACNGQKAVINAAGNVTDGQQFVELFDAVTGAVEAGLGGNGRYWTFGGAAALDVPGTDTMTTTLPKVPALFNAHARNFARLKASPLSWSMLCPGPMIPASDGQPHAGLRLASDCWPVPRPGVTRYLPRMATSLAFKRAIPELTICYEDAARVILDNLAADSPYVKRRVGIALPIGIRQNKDLSELTR